MTGLCVLDRLSGIRGRENHSLVLSWYKKLVTIDMGWLGMLVSSCHVIVVFLERYP